MHHPNWLPSWHPPYWQKHAQVIVLLTFRLGTSSPSECQWSRLPEWINQNYLLPSHPTPTDKQWKSQFRICATLLIVFIGLKKIIEQTLPNVLQVLFLVHLLPHRGLQRWKKSSSKTFKYWMRLKYLTNVRGCQIKPTCTICSPPSLTSSPPRRSQALPTIWKIYLSVKNS